MKWQGRLVVKFVFLNSWLDPNPKRKSFVTVELQKLKKRVNRLKDLLEIVLDKILITAEHMKEDIKQPRREEEIKERLRTLTSLVQCLNETVNK